MIEQLNKYKEMLKSVGISDLSLAGSYIAGGAIRSLVLGEPVKDVDIFCRNEEVIENIIKDITKQDENIRNHYLTTGIFYPALSIVESDNAYTFTIKGVQFQLIKIKTGQPLEVIGEFDFEMNMNYFEFVEGAVPYFHNLDAVKTKTLTINKNCRNKLGTLARLEKFLKRGYNIGDKLNLLRLGQQISHLEPIKTMSSLENESKLYFTFEEFEKIDFVEKDSEAKFTSKYFGSAF